MVYPVDKEDGTQEIEQRAQLDLRTAGKNRLSIKWSSVS